MANPSILVVDDEEINVLSITELLDEEGLSYQTARNGSEALDIVRSAEHPFKAIILDWMMPVMDGMETLEALKADPRLQSIPVVMQTAKAQDADLIAGYEKGVFQYLTKPYSERVLLSMVNSALDLHNKLERLKQEKSEAVARLADSSFKMLESQEQSLELDLQSAQSLNDYLLGSLDVESLEDLAAYTFESLKGFRFPSADPDAVPEDQFLRCSLLLDASEGAETLAVKNTGTVGPLERVIMEKSLSTVKVHQRGFYTAVPSPKGMVSLLIRNTPEDRDEMERAISLATAMIKQIESQVLTFDLRAQIEAI